MSSSLWHVAVNAPLPQVLTYQSELPLNAGQSVQVPLGKRQIDGVVLSSADSAGEFKIKNIKDVHEERPQLSQHHLDWAKWLAEYYSYPLGQVLNLFFPPLKKQKKARKSHKAPVIPEVELKERPSLTEEQEKVFGDISKHEGFGVHMLFGVTGSGKTEVYLRLLEETLAKGQKGLVLVPEISLTPQLVERFASRFGPKIAAIHSHLTEREKTNQWWSMVSGEKQILIGARSALFCPFDDLGLIIIDEEHESSFKQEEKLKYHARDAAIMLAQKTNCPIALGSATPSLESWENTLSGKFHLHEMKARVQNRALPEIQIVDLKEKDQYEKPKEDLPFWLTPPLYTALKENFEAGSQAALFLNRRGIAQTVTCPACADTRECPNCAISLTLHGKSHLVCHYCDYHETLHETCTVCGEGEPTPLGLGTERVEEDLQKLFPEARIARADRDEISTREQLEDLIFKVERSEVDFLVGTQMIAKGLDFPNLKLVGLVLADVGFNLPDFRAGERIFQLIMQVSGRAGRHVKPGESPGQVVLQTYNPDHPALKFALNHDYAGFADYELQFRRQLKYPPSGRLASLRIQGNDRSKTMSTAKDLLQRANHLKEKFEKYGEVQLLGPAEAPLAKLRGKYRFHLLIKGEKSGPMIAFCTHLTQNQKWLPSGVKLLVDIDPMNLL